MKKNHFTCLSLLFFYFFNTHSMHPDRDLVHSISDNWDLVANDSSNTVGYHVNAKLFIDDDDYCTHQRLSIFSTGFYTPTKNYSRTPSFTEFFPVMPERQIKGGLPGDFLIINAPNANQTKEKLNRNCYFGQKQDAFSYIYVLNKLKLFGIKEITTHAQCYGILRLINILYYLSNNQQINEVENFFLKAGINRIDREKLLSMFTTIHMHTPLKNVSDGPIALYSKAIAIGNTASMLTGMALLSRHNEKKEITIAGLSFLVAPVLVNSLKHLVTRNIIMPYLYPYDAYEKTETEKLQLIHYFKQAYPKLSLLMTTGKNDEVVGNWGIEHFFNNLPIHEDQKFLIPSSKIGHYCIDKKHFEAKNAFLRRFGSSYHNFPKDQMDEGEKHLDFAQKGQRENLAEYIEYMESDHNYPY